MCRPWPAFDTAGLSRLHGAILAGQARYIAIQSLHSPRRIFPHRAVLTDTQPQPVQCVRRTALSCKPTANEM